MHLLTDESNINTIVGPLKGCSVRFGCLLVLNEVKGAKTHINMLLFSYLELVMKLFYDILIVNLSFLTFQKVGRWNAKLGIVVCSRCDLGCTNT